MFVIEESSSLSGKFFLIDDRTPGVGISRDQSLSIFDCSITPWVRRSKPGSILKGDCMDSSEIGV